tara:strand:+ start:11 stop:232 length:222 start_codon:yes stop_codon:yes gene_type:complete
MENEYQTKDIQGASNKMEAPKPSKMEAPEKYDDGHIFGRDGMFFFKWKGSECGYHSQSDAEAGLKKLSGNGES